LILKIKEREIIMPENNRKQTGQPAAVPIPFIKMEESVLDFWQSAKIFEKSLLKDAPRGDYVFYDGPPFATGTPHYGHLVASLMKDTVPRYFAMKGYRVERKWGWDCHGLPIENIVEKELKTKSKKDIETLGVAKFNDFCRSKVLLYADEWKKIIGRFGRWADMDNPYKTMDLGYMETIWWVLRQLWDKGLIYQDYRSMYVCPRCETTLSQSEVAEGYRNIKDLAVTVKFALKDEPDTYILAWTTTPWTLIGNVALAVGKDIDYVKVKYPLDRLMEAKNLVLNQSLEPTARTFESYFILAKARLGSVFSGLKPEIVSEFKGVELVGKSYQPLFNYYAADEKLANRERGWKIYAADFVTTEDGTGVVHIAPAFGEDDMVLGKKEKLPFVQHVNMDGTFKAEVKDFPGQRVKPIDDYTSTDEEILKYLADRGLVFSQEKYEHSYPYCWRCDTPLINYATASWFVNVSKLKPALLKYAKNINWSPAYIKEGRFGKWLEGAHDWSISRQRFWASAIPIWECEKCEERIMLGSVKELEELSGQKITDIHKDKVDPITFPCKKCGGAMKRIPDVLDCWFESGSMPYAQFHYPFENKEKFNVNFPAAFIAEGADQTRAWFYYLHVLAGALKNSHAFHHVIVNGTVLAEDGKKMSKKLRNYSDPKEIMEKYGADALRAYLLGLPVMQAENMNFSEKGVADALRKNIMVLWNVYKFYKMFAGEAEGGEEKAPASDNVLDIWILAKLAELKNEVRQSMEEYDLPRAMRPITEFINELSTWYLRRSRDRFKAEDKVDKQQALLTTRYVFLELAKLMAPFTPFIAETLWQKVTGHDFKDENQSVHLENYPLAEGIREKQKEILNLMAKTRAIVEAGLAKRDSAGIKIRQMLNKITVSGQEELTPEYLRLLADELNVREVKFMASGDKLEVELDTTITPGLKAEGLKREVIRAVNMLRKEADLTLSDQATIYLVGAKGEVKAAVEKNKSEITKETLSDDLILSDKLPLGLATKEIKIDGAKLRLALKK